MVKFTDNALTLAAGTVKVENVSDADVSMSIYVSNKDSVPCNVPAGAKVTITTLSAGETYFYLNQASESLSVTTA